MFETEFEMEAFWEFSIEAFTLNFISFGVQK